VKKDSGDKTASGDVRNPSTAGVGMNAMFADSVPRFSSMNKAIDYGHG
jgi:hypothetical protein